MPPEWSLFNAHSDLARPHCIATRGLRRRLSGNPTSTTPPSSTAPAITTQPSSPSVTVDQTATFSVTATGTAPLSYQWQKSGTSITGATASSYTTAATTLADNGATFKVTISNAAGSITSEAATLTVLAAAAASTDVLTYHNDNSRSAQNLTETVLTPTNVNATQFGLLRVLPADGLVDGQPLIVSNLSVSGVSRNVVYAVTENDSVYSYDADTGAALVHVSALGSGETPSDTRGCSQVTPQIGITLTPVIDRSAGPNGTPLCGGHVEKCGRRLHSATACPGPRHPGRAPEQSRSDSGDLPRHCEQQRGHYIIRRPDNMKSAPVFCC